MDSPDFSDEAYIVPFACRKRFAQPGVDRFARYAKPFGDVGNGMAALENLLDRFPLELIRINCDSRRHLPWL